MKLTTNFSLSEFECKCGCEMPEDVKENIQEVAKNLQVIRDVLKAPIRVNSSYRCPKHNKAIGGVKNSQHVLGKAADIRCDFISIDSLHKTILELIKEGKICSGGVGKYKTFIHYDTRGRNARWKG